MLRFHALAAAALISFAGGSPVLAQTPSSGTGEPNVANGKYMYYAGGCASCHAAPASNKCDDAKTKDELAPVGGRCLKSEFGTFYVPNITPDKETGIGGWSSEDFIKAMTTGTSPKGENYYPAFPYASYQKMTRSDLLDLWAFLQTIAPVSATVPGHDLSFPYSIRRGVRLWKSLYLDGKTFVPDPSKSAQINRGAYLAEGPGHCGECHTPRTSLGGMIAAKKMSGAPDPAGKDFIPNITPDKTGIGSWSEKDISYALQSGFTPEGDVLGSTMAKVQQNMAQLTPEDRDAIAAYLKSIPAVVNERPKKKSP
jgi:mono/diheme cytochrome c family protein